MEDTTAYKCKLVPRTSFLSCLVSGTLILCLQEAITAGVPLITIALFGDQPRNAKLAQRHHFAINLSKGELSADTIAEALKTLLEDERFALDNSCQKQAHKMGVDRIVDVRVGV